MTDKNGDLGEGGRTPGDLVQHERMLNDLFEKYRNWGKSQNGNYSKSFNKKRTKKVNETGFDPPERDAKESLKVENGLTKKGWVALNGEFGVGNGNWKPSPGMHRSRAGTGPSRYDPKRIDDVLRVERNRRGWNRSIAAGTIVGDWNQIVGPIVAKHCTVQSFSQGTLVVQADSTAWAQQLRVLLPQVQRRIDEEVEPGVVEQVIVKAPKAPSWKRGPRSVKGRGPRDTYG